RSDRGKHPTRALAEGDGAAVGPGGGGPHAGSGASSRRGIRRRRPLPGLRSTADRPVATRGHPRHGTAPPHRHRIPPAGLSDGGRRPRSEEHTSELQSRENLVCRLLLEKKKKIKQTTMNR